MYLRLDDTNVEQFGTIKWFLICLLHKKDQVTEILSLQERVYPLHELIQMIFTVAIWYYDCTYKRVSKIVDLWINI